MFGFKTWLLGSLALQYATASVSGKSDPHEEADGFRGPQQQQVFQNSKSQQQEYPDKLRVAVIGAGSAGSSEAYFLHFLSEQGLLPPLTLDIYERDVYVGGRCMPIELPCGPPNESAPVAELGASIFVEKNRHLMHAVDKFGLTLQSGHGGGRIEDALMAIWDGEQYVYRDNNGWGWWDTAKMLWKYGMSPIRAQRLMKETLQRLVHCFICPKGTCAYNGSQLHGRFISVYSNDFYASGPSRSIPDFAQRAGFENLYEVSGRDYLLQHGVSNNFTSDLIAAGTTVNYAQTPGEMHALETLVSIAAEGASSVKGGNNQIFEQFVARSGAALHLEHQVTRIEKLEAPSKESTRAQWALTAVSESGKQKAETYDLLVVAAPWHQTDLQIVGSSAPALLGPPVEYVKLFVTIVITNATAPRACFFNPKWACNDAAPQTVLATLAPWQDGLVSAKPRVNSLNYLRELEKGKYAVKIFSRHAIDESELAEAFGPENLIFSFQQSWLSYPFVKPVKPADFAPLKLDQGLYYTSPMEQLISTMETSSISAWNVASMIVSDYTPNQVNQSWPEWSSN